MILQSLSYVQEELKLLGHDTLDYTESASHELKTAPVFARQAYVSAGGKDVFPQRGLLGNVFARS